MLLRETLRFLSDLDKNNNKDWFEANRTVYEKAKANVTDLVADLLNGIATFDEHVIGIAPSKALFRIHRDVRFSKDKSPYKTNFGARLQPKESQHARAGYYLHIEPGECFVAGGLYMAEPHALSAVRQAIDSDPGRFTTIAESTSFKKMFGELKGDQLKRVPKGYQQDHPMASYLKYKSFLMVRAFGEKEMLEKDFVKNALQYYKGMKPLNDFINEAVSETAEIK
ncbi:MAG: DUF2461 domain-containing protein [Flavobacteriales bacterium]|nr:DUF2461 domain-containing protein [Flavobacteriales bacterium]